MTRAKSVVAVLLAATLFLSLTGIAVAATKRVRAKGERWRPVHTYIARGDRVKWLNPTNRVHDLKAMKNWSFSRVLQPGTSVARKFRQRGTYPYRCVRHSAVVGGKCQGMCGFVHVVG